MKNRLALPCGVCALLCLIFSSPQVIDCAAAGLRLCGTLIVPSLFPFFVASMLLSRAGLPQLLSRIFSPAASKLFGVSGQGISAFFMGICGGYPMGCACVAELWAQGLIDEKEAERLLCFCNNSGPAFIIGAVGTGVFGSPQVGLILYGVHILSAVTVGILFRKKGAVTAGELLPCRPEPPLQAFTHAVDGAVTATLTVCGFIIVFSVFTGLLDCWGIIGRFAALFQNESLARGLFMGFFELSGGVSALRGIAYDPIVYAAASALIGWGGLSVHFQSMALLSDTKIKGALHFAGHLFSAVISFALTYLIFSLKN